MLLFLLFRSILVAFQTKRGNSESRSSTEPCFTSLCLTTWQYFCQDEAWWFRAETTASNRDLPGAFISGCIKLNCVNKGRSMDKLYAVIILNSINWQEVNRVLQQFLESFYGFLYKTYKYQYLNLEKKPGLEKHSPHAFGEIIINLEIKNATGS